VKLKLNSFVIKGLSKKEDLENFNIKIHIPDAEAKFLSLDKCQRANNSFLINDCIVKI
jgi:hypothetical protein